MPLTKKGQTIKRAMDQQYGKKKAEQVFYASKNAGTISGVDRPKKGAGVSKSAPSANSGKSGLMNKAKK